MSSDDTMIRVSQLSKRYEIYDTPRDRLKQFVLPRLLRGGGEPKRYFREFWALQDINFTVKKGETVGIIGRNGSGKSTLLQIICGTLSPTSGQVETRGRIAAMLELGSGFNPEFTGRENVYMNATVLGLTEEEIDARFDRIAAFADIGEFMNQPIKTYSSGMTVRLAFAVQSQIDPDILIVDEALSVGDAKFQAKCFDRLRQLKDNGTSILLVTHSSEQIVTHCTSAILLNQGVQLESGKPKQVVNRYLDLLFGKEKQALPDDKVNAARQAPTPLDTDEHGLNLSEDVFATRPGYNPHEYRWGDGTASILDFHLAADGVPYPAVISTGQRISLSVSVKFHASFYRPILGITIKTKEGVTIYGVNSETLECASFQEMGSPGSVMQADAAFVCRLAPGDYFISLGIASKEGEEAVPHDRRYDSIHLQVGPNPALFGLVDLELNMMAKEVVA
jgi:lipopolysaccharide transport system ATP-binding protein